MATATMTEEQRAAALRDAESKAVELFAAIEKDLIRSGVREKALSDEIHKLGVEKYSVRTHWHKRIVRSGPNTLRPFDDNPPDRVIEADDILVVDLGPVFQEWEADFGRTYVLGNDPEKQRLRDALEPMWHKIKASFQERPGTTGDEFYKLAVKNGEEEGWKWNAHIAGHVVGDFPHERIPKDKVSLYITDGNDQPMIQPGKNGFNRHWILEVHLRDPQDRYAGFFEQLLTVD